MKRAWFQRIRGWGCQTLVYGEKPMFYYLVVFYLCYLSPFLSYPTSFNLFNVLLGSWAAMAVGGWAVIAFGSGVAGLSVLCPHPHSTHDSMLALPVLFSSRACSLCPWCILSTACSLTHHDFESVGSSRTGFGRIWSHMGVLFLSTSCCSPSRRELLLLLTHSQFRVLSAVVVHPRAQEELFIPHGV